MLSRIVCPTVMVAMAASLAFAEYAVTDIVGAAKRGDGHAVHKLIKIDPECVQATDGSGYTALHWAAIRGHWRIVSELVAAGAPTNVIGGDGGTPLHWACHHDQPEIIALLIDNGADVTLKNRWGRTALHTAARRGCSSVAGVLLKNGADPNQTTKEGWTPLHVAAMSDHPEVTQVLLAHGADPEIQDQDGHRPDQVARTRPDAIDLDSERLDEYTGIYDLGGGFTAKVWRKDKALRFREFAPDDLYPISPDAFFCRHEPWQVNFTRSETGEVDGVRIDFLRRSVRGTRMNSPQYVGSAVCRSCHESGPQGGAWVSWLRGRHAHAYWRLGSDWAIYLARLRPHYSDLEQPISDERCLLCHVTGRQDDNGLFADSFRVEEGVGCESCHGPGSLYVEPANMSDRGLFLAAGGTIPDASTCATCHRNSDNFDFDTWWPKIAHGTAAP